MLFLTTGVFLPFPFSLPVNLFLLFPAFKPLRLLYKYLSTSFYCHIHETKPVVSSFYPFSSFISIAGLRADLLHSLVLVEFFDISINMHAQKRKKWRMAFFHLSRAFYVQSFGALSFFSL